MDNKDIFGYVYAAAVAAGGVMGYVKAGSVPSLVAGVTFGALLAYGATRASKNPNDITVSLVTSLALAAFMGYRYTKTGKIMPAGATTLLSLVMAGKYGKQYLQ